ncbi:hypothetical protein B0T17DRAFT_594057 [Bombardia bombarda]|uniref:Zn(2)-C6 fungal-type domain-containing protein n=1 Tax=Bombardia bombarda TaxID=252184 RepID=A0AA39TVJ4_9PEZI|nr:hypothetical protein B0T17DRAFT_594057 [Bombardia bombarda]
MPSSEKQSVSGSSPQSLAIFGCENCRAQHLKCDRVTPTCGRCQTANRKCLRTGLRIREMKDKFTKTQKWVKTPRRLVFIDETKSVTNEALSHDSGVDEFEADNLASPPVSEDLGPQESLLSSVDRSSNATLAGGPKSPSDRFLLRSKPLDLCDPRQSFETSVPQRAGTNSILLNAIFALSARHMSHIRSDFDPFLFIKYHTECLSSLRPMHEHPENFSDENLFAATIILRVLEEMEAKHEGTNNHRYLRGIQLFVENSEEQLLPGSLNAASFWVGLRQEIYSAVMNHWRVRIKLVSSLVDPERNLTPTDDYTWANRAVVHCADVLNFCFKDNPSDVDEEYPTTPRAHRWDELNEWNKQWQELQPASYTPLFRQSARDGPFPEVWYHRSCHVIGVQHHLLAKLFLVCSNPRIPDPRLPSIYGQRRASERDLTDRVQSIVRTLCGIGLGNQWTPPGMFTACMAISAFGDRFHDRRDQQGMLDILKKTEKDHARPTEAVQHQMMRDWGWNDEATY